MRWRCSQGVAMLMLAATLSSEGRAQSGIQDAPKIVMDSGTGVNLLDLGYTFSNADLSIGDLVLTRYYASENYKSNNPFSNSWTHNFDIWIASYIFKNQATVSVTIGQRISRFFGTYNSNFPENDEAGTYVEMNGGVPTFTDRDGVVYRFIAGPPSPVSSISKPNGETVSFYYVSNKLRQVRSNHGYAIAFEYSGANIASACSFNLANQYVATSDGCAAAGRKVLYSYPSGRLGSFTDVAGQYATYGYNAGGYLVCPTGVGQTQCLVTRVRTR